MILNDDEALTRLESPKNLINTLKNQVVVKDIDKGGRGEVKGIPPLVRKLLTITSVSSDEDQSEIAEQFGISQQRVSQLERGLSDAQCKDVELVGIASTAKKKKLENAHELALDALNGSLSSLVGRMAEIDKPEKLSRVASDMSKVLNNLGTGKTDDEVVKTKVIFFAPGMRVENNYETVEV